ncbi:family 78 glycoside hydrolase catalytic domain [Pedobacter sp. SYP-B3415]|uniref:alpha-L-rhamnosidase-related protein n=1 Tax=Pedobacter sp. SYP-B3415 TaxID=2496641 RepID=UPI00101DF7EE|nr:family 78 glycoside hydrolase catalytic domain [Pedobacter sp. SYP-B3415]
MYIFKKLSKSACLFLSFFFIMQSLQAQTASWIWYPGDFDIWMSNVMQNRRTERGSFFPPFWKMDSHYALVDFHKEVTVPAEEEVLVKVEGQYNLKIDGKAIPASPGTFRVPAGKHRISLKVYNQAHVPAVFIRGKTIHSDTSWLATFEDKEWIDASGKTSDKSGTTFVPAGSWGMTDMAVLPSAYRLPVKPVEAVKVEKLAGGFIADFGRETFGFVRLKGLRGSGLITLYYGESKEEALSKEFCETLDILDINNPEKRDSVLSLSKAFRFVQVEHGLGIQLDGIGMDYEFAPVNNRGSFRCNDAGINKIWDIARYTFELNTREFFIDGIKRDRWVWSGDAYQSYLMNYYAFFDSPTVVRTLWAQRGKDPVTAHINTIMDYSFYWFLGIYDYYNYTGDKNFVKAIYPRMKTLMEFTNKRRNSEGLLEWMPGDWVFIDWAEGLSKEGAVSFEQVLFCRSLETMALCADLAEDTAAALAYRTQASALREKIFSLYWDEKKQALVHSRIKGKPAGNVTRYANMFGIFFDYFNAPQKQQVKKSVLLNNDVKKITTPYMRFYELEALCALGEQTLVTKEIKDYWGGMLKLGATSFWEEYNPDKSGAGHLAMYGRPFGKSLCHAWGASPLYLLGKYYLGVKPLSPGYATYLVEPSRGGLEWIEGTVPTPKGDVQVYASSREIRVRAARGEGLLRFTSKSKPGRDGASARKTGNGQYELALQPGKSYTVSLRN